MDTTTSFHFHARRSMRAGAARALVCASAIALMLLVVVGRAAAQQRPADTTVKPTPTIAQNAATLLDSLRKLRAVADTTTRRRIDSQIAALLPPPPPVNPLLVRGLKAIPELTRGATKHNLVTLQLNGPTDTNLRVMLTNMDTAGTPHQIPLVPEAYSDSELVVRTPDVGGTFKVQVYANGDTLKNYLRWPQLLHVESIGWLIFLGVISIVVIILLLAWILHKYRDPFGNRTDSPYHRGRRRLLLRLLLLEPQNQTYSLSRAQFIFWMLILAFSYVFIFFAQGLVRQIWAFPPLVGFAWTFIISLGTLLTAQATTTVRGAKGAGEEHPSFTDLFVHGGVIALERVQQALWTLITAILFVYILVKNYSVATEMPQIPQELLYLMGISSAGYLVGKGIRKPGPVVAQVCPATNDIPPGDAQCVDNGTMMIVIRGRNLSNNAAVWLDGTQLPGNAAPVTHDIDAAPEFASKIKIALPSTFTSAEDWNKGKHTVVVVNADAQRAEWKTPEPSAQPAPGGAANPAGDPAPVNPVPADPVPANPAPSAGTTTSGGMNAEEAGGSVAGPGTAPAGA